MISVIVPIYNIEKYLPRCLDSIINQTYNDLEIILVNDGSKDGSGDICDDYAKKDSRIKVIHKENGGVSSARNMGLDIAKGEYIGFVDSDDYIDSNFFEEMMGKMLKTNCDIVVCDVSFEDESGKYYKTNQITNNKRLNKIELFEKILTSENIGGYLWNKLFKKELIDEERMDENLHYSEDFEFVSRYLKKCNFGVLCDNICYHYYKNDGSITVSESYNSKKFSVLEAYEKIVKIYFEFAPKQVIEIDKNIFYTAIKLRKSYRKNGGNNKYEYDIINKTIYRRFLKLIFSPQISPRTKMYIFARFFGIVDFRNKLSEILNKK